MIEMDRLCRFTEKPITIDEKVGLLLMPIEMWRAGYGKHPWRYTAKYNAQIFFKDSHYRFVWREGDTIYEKVVSGNALRPAKGDAPHGARRLRTIEGRGILGRIEEYKVNSGRIKELTDLIEQHQRELRITKTKVRYEAVLRQYGI